MFFVDLAIGWHLYSLYTYAGINCQLSRQFFLGLSRYMTYYTSIFFHHAQLHSNTHVFLAVATKLSMFRRSPSCFCCDRTSRRGGQRILLV